MRPVRIAKEVQDAYIPVMDEAIQYDWSDRKIRIEGTPVEKEPVLVQRFHIDTNHHMNNGKYILVAEEYLPENTKRLQSSGTCYTRRFMSSRTE